MRTSKKKFYRKRQTASAMAVLLTVLSPGVFPAGIAMAENAGGWITEGRAGHARVTESNGSVDSSEILEEVWDEEEPEEETSQEAEERVAVVEPGGSFCQIARDYLGDEGRAAELAEHNGMTLDDMLYAGMELRLPN